MPRRAPAPTEMTDPAATDYANRLGDALETLLEAGADDLATLAAGLARLGVAAPDGGDWTADRLAAEFARLGR